MRKDFLYLKLSFISYNTRNKTDFETEFFYINKYVVTTSLRIKNKKNTHDYSKKTTQVNYLKKVISSVLQFNISHNRKRRRNI